MGLRALEGQHGSCHRDPPGLPTGVTPPRSRADRSRYCAAADWFKATRFLADSVSTDPAVATVETDPPGRPTATEPLDLDSVPWHTELCRALTTVSDSAAALGAVCEVVHRRLPCDRVQVWRGDIRQMTMRSVVAAGYPEADARRLRDLIVPMVGMPLAPDFLERKCLVLEAVQGMGGYGEVLFDAFGVRAAAFLLLERGERVLGAMQLSWCETARPGAPPAPVTEIIRRYAALALDIHARTDEALQTAATLSETAILLSTIHDPEALLQAMAGKIAEALGCDWGAVHLVDDTTEVLRYAAGMGPPEAVASLRRMERARRLVEQTFAHADDGLIEVPDARAAPALRAWGVDQAISSLLSLPLQREGALVGVLTLGYCQRAGRFSRRQVALAKGLAHHAVAALENARLVRSLQQVNQAKTDFVAAVSHDLRTPLQILIGYNDMLLEGAAGPLTAPQQELVTRMRECSGRFLDLISGILEVAALEAGRERTTHAPVPLRAVCAALATEVEVLRRPGVELRWQVDSGAPYGDGPKIKMILRNLITNALKFTTAGTVEVCCGRHDGALVLRVTDTGPGVDPADRAQIFEMFQQGDAGRRAGGSGLGLGLYLVKRLAEVMGGAVMLRSGEPGHTSFEVSLPTGNGDRPAPVTA